jgi:hypothetical protein
VVVAIPARLVVSPVAEVVSLARWPAVPAAIPVRPVVASPARRVPAPSVVVAAAILVRPVVASPALREED